jgi:hypothetical protein
MTLLEEKDHVVAVNAVLKLEKRFSSQIQRPECQSQLVLLHQEGRPGCLDAFQ